jgi:mRNA interferase HigB
VRVIKPSRIREYARAYPDAEKALLVWLDAARKAEWTSIQDVRRELSTADGVSVNSGRTVTLFNIRGNNYRLITAIHYRPVKRIFVLRFLTHKEYDTERWKAEL